MNTFFKIRQLLELEILMCILQSHLQCINSWLLHTKNREEERKILFPNEITHLYNVTGKNK